MDHTQEALLQKARKAFARGRKHQARQWAQKAAHQNPGEEEPWLILAEISEPKASLVYLKNALEINPGSEIARRKIHQAVKRWRAQEEEKQRKARLAPQITSQSLVQSRPALFPWIVSFLILISVFATWLWTPDFSFAFTGPQPSPMIGKNYAKATFTSTPTATFTPTATPTSTPTFTPTFTPTNTPTSTPTATPTDPPPPTKPPGVKLPPGIDHNERWFDLNLTQQRLRAYEGKTLVKTFVVSTGTWLTPTVTGRYRIYVKYRSTHMSGPGYYLPNVPYTMYFYEGYGIHGTYWHNNFGTPMSHGCVNLRTPDAKWAYNWAKVGTLVNIHY